jgi:hypothetical protein
MADVAAVPQGPDDLHRLAQHVVTDIGAGPPSTDDVLIEVLACAQP